MLMNASVEARYEFVARITQGQAPAYRRTQEGDQAKQDWWRAHQPMLYAGWRIQDHREAA